MKTKLTLLLIVAVWLAGCGHAVQRYNSSAVDYLYPDKERFVERTGLPHLQLPIKVGVAFVPDNQKASRYRQSDFWKGGGAHVEGAVLTEADKTVLLEKVGQRFEKFDFFLHPRDHSVSLSRSTRQFSQPRSDSHHVRYRCDCSGILRSNPIYG